MHLAAARTIVGAVDLPFRRVTNPAGEVRARHQIAVALSDLVPAR